MLFGKNPFPLLLHPGIKKSFFYQINVALHPIDFSKKRSFLLVFKQTFLKHVLLFLKHVTFLKRVTFLKHVIFLKHVVLFGACLDS